MALTPWWYCKLFLLTTGAVLGELPLTQDPAWSQQINQSGSWTALTPIGGSGGLSKATLRSLAKGGRVGVACCFGTGAATDYIAQAGPIWTGQCPQEQPSVWQLGGAGFASLLAATDLIDPNTATPLVVTNSMQGIAVALLNAAQALNPLPVDIPAGPFTGITTMTYQWYDFATVWQRLQELTQLAGGPDVYFRPYFSDSSHIRWQAVVGNPYITQAGAPLLFDYGSNLTSCLPSSDSSKLATTVYAKGNGVEAGILWRQAVDTTLTGNGYPKLVYNDSSHSDVIDLNVLANWASGDLALYGRSVETWAATARTDMSPLLGSYGPGVFANYNFGDDSHPIIPAGMYSQRILGLQRSGTGGPDEVEHILHAIQGAM
jgi:hypothetical protein